MLLSLLNLQIQYYLLALFIAYRNAWLGSKKLLFIDIIVNKNSRLSEGYTVNPPNIRLDEDVFNRSQVSYKNVFKTSSRRLQHIFKTFSRRLPRRLQDIFKLSSRRLPDILQKYLQGVFMTFDQVKLFLLTSLREVFNTFLRRTA